MLKRKLYSEIRNHLKEKDFSIIIGARQSGKTTLLEQLNEELIEGGEKVFFISLEDKDVVNNLNEHPDNIFSYAILSKTSKTYFLIDEIQYLDDPSNFLKLLYDKYHDKIKIIATGSSAFYIDRKFKDSLAGRKQIFHLHTLDFDEFIYFKTENHILLDELNDIRSNKKYISLKRREITVLFKEYLMYGGYPAVVVANNVERKKLLLKDLVQSYLKKDIYEAKIRDEKKFYDLLLILANQIGNLLNTNELSNTLGLSVTAVENYIYILQKSFHIQLIRPFHTNIRKELTKMPKVYFNDIGFRNALLNNYQEIEMRLDKGELTENYALIRLREKYDNGFIKFWRTADGNEVDFVIDNPAKAEKEAFEIKFNSNAFKKSKYKKFISSYPDIKFQLRSFLTQDNSIDIMAL